MANIEKMDAFFAARLEGYDAHMLENVEGLAEGYEAVARQLPEGTARLLDLGCGTGLELAPVFARFPNLAVTGIDLTLPMLDALRAKYPGKTLRLIHGDYFTTPLGTEAFDAAISVESLHHFTHDEKLGLYRRLHRAIAPGGRYIEMDFVADSPAQEAALFAERARLLAVQGAGEGYWHFDTPMTQAHQIALLEEAGFTGVRAVWRTAATVALVAER